VDEASTVPTARTFTAIGFWTTGAVVTAMAGGAPPLPSDAGDEAPPEQAAVKRQKAVAVTLPARIHLQV
jgi:hypothetical protein